ncbi:energy-coupling factor transporter transmembrane protein EcfT [Staphylococcus chromogenes]|nr:energy-coupling factor transporter transmembrane protein EcfT [Staphylococcus chromogenes]
MIQAPLGVYVPGTSILHRLPPGWKFLILIAFIVASALFVSTAAVGLALCALMGVGYAVARIPFKVARGQLLPVLPILAVIFAFQWWQLGWNEALTMFFTIYASIAAATLLTLTTPLSELMEAFDRGLVPLGRLGIPVATISLAMSLTLRLIPLQAQALGEALAARKARGADFSIRALAVPVLIRSMRRAEAIGDALLARGVGDGDA